MKILVNSLLVVFALMFAASCSHKGPWKLFFEDNFDKKCLDSTVWHKIPRNTCAWGKYMSSDPRLYDLRNGCMVLRGIVNDNLETDKAPYLTGGIETSGLKALPSPARYEIRARLHAARGAWPAFWLLPFDDKDCPYPKGGEIDIMEHLNGDDIVYQTVHSYYTLDLKHPEEPPHGAKGKIKVDDFNVYGVDIMPDSLVFRINGKKTLTYPRLPEKEWQYPFLIPQYLMLDMQLGGSWVGKIYPEDLPVEMEIDWVKVYKYCP